LVERLETRLAPANVDVLSNHADIPAVANYPDSKFLTGQNLEETTLTPANVNAANFGTLFSSAIDGQAYAQPLYKANLDIPGMGTHNVAFLATEHDSVYAFDADNGTLIWHDSFIDPANGITTIPYAELSTPDLYPEIGITGTPVIDGDTSTLYVVVKTKEIRGDGGVHYVQKLHALDLTNGADKFGGPYQLGDTHVASLGATPVFANETTAILVHGSGGESSGGANPRVPFSAERENERMSLELIGNIVFTSFASHADYRPYHGWVIGFDKTTLQPVKVFNTAPNADGVGIWESGGGLSWDGSYLYFAVGNGFGSNAYDPSQGNYSESVIKLDPTPDWNPSTLQMMTVADYFTPFNWQQLDNQDQDLGSGGVMLLPDSVGSAAHPHLLVETGKQGKLYLIDRDNMGQFTSGGPDHVVQTVTAGQTGVWGNPAYAQVNSTTGIIYYHGSGDVLKGYYVSNGHIDDTSGHILQSTYRSNFPGEQPSVSADGTNDPLNPVNGIVWELQVDNAAGRIQGQGDNTVAGPATLRAFSTTSLSPVLYDSSQTGQRDAFGGSVKFTFPVVTNGHVLVGTADHFSVLGMFPTATAAPNAASGLTAQVQTTAQGPQIVLNWTNPDPNPGADPTGIKILRSTDGVNFTLYNTVSRNLTSFADSGPLQVGQRYYYEVVATNQVGDAAPSNVDSAAVPIASAVLTLTGTGATSVGLSWTAVTDGHYDIDRSTDGINFTTVATVPAPLTTYTDTGLVPGLYTYQIHAVNADSSGDSLSNALGAWVGPTFDHSTPANGGFSDPTDLTTNGSAFVGGDLLELTSAVNQTGSAFSNTRITAGSFTTTFEVRVHEGSQGLGYADGFVFVLQANDPSALGQGTSGIGYQGINHSVAIYFSTYQHTGDPSSSSTGLVFNGAAPRGGVDTTPSGVLLNSQDIKQITLTYDGTTLTEQIMDVMTGQTFTHSFAVNIPQILGSDTGYVGFTGASGSGGYWELEDVLSWQFTSFVPLPGAPTNLRVTAFASSAVDLAWNGNSYNENYFQVERSTDGTNFTAIGTTTGLTFEDGGLANGTYSYRVTAVNGAGNSAYTGTLLVTLPGPLLTQHQDIGTSGDPGIAGSATFANGTYTLRASGSDVWNTTDHFQYLYRPFLGDGEIVARVVTEQSGVNDFAKAGVMFRDSLAAGAENAYMLEFPSGSRNYPTYQWRPTTNGATMDHELSSAHPVPIWLRLVRSGNTFTGYWAMDTGGGNHGPWNQLGSETVAMGASVYVGLALTSHNNGSLITATFDHLQILPAVLQVSHFDVSTTVTTVTAGTAIDITVKALDPFNNIVTGYTGTVTFSSSDVQAGLPAQYTFSAGDNGVHTFSGQTTLYTAGVQNVIATDDTGIAGLTTVTVQAAPAVAFQVIAPASAVSGVPFDVTVIAVDPYGNADPNFTGTVTFSTSDPDPGVVVPGPYTFGPANAGTVTFPGGVTLITVGDQTLTATDAPDGLSGSTIITVTGGPSPHGHLGPRFAPVAWWPAGAAPIAGGSSPPLATAEWSLNRSPEFRPSYFVLRAANDEAQRTKNEAPTRVELIDQALSNGAAWLLADPLAETL
jgi:hypothetical protein